MKFLLLTWAMSASAAVVSPVTVTLKNTNNKTVGTATLTQLKNGVKIQLNVKGLAAGEHALHFHETGSCLGPKFDSAGGHFAPLKNKHGFDEEGGPHAGDMANLIVGKDGLGHLETVNTAVTLNAGENSLLKESGAALVIHEKADDHKSQPAGNAGPRVVCGEIKGG